MWIANQIARFSTTPTTAAVMADRAPCRAWLPRSTSMKGAPRKMNRKHGHEGHPGGEQAAERARHERRQRAGIAEGAHEAHELEHHDERAGRGLGHAEAVEHLAGLEPAVVLDRLLGDVGQHRVGAAEGHDRHGREEGGDLAEHVVGAERHEEHGDGHEPQGEADRRRRAAPAPRSGGHARAVPRRAGLRHPRPACRPWPGRARLRPGRPAAPARPPTKPIRPAVRTMIGNGTPKKKIATKAAAASADHDPVLERLRCRSAPPPGARPRARRP